MNKTASDVQRATPAASSSTAEVPSNRRLRLPQLPESPRLRGGAATLVVLIAVSGWFSIHNFLAWRTQHNLDQARDNAVATAKRAVADLSTMDKDTIADRMDDLMSISSGQFRSQLASDRAAQISAVKKADVISAGTIDSVGVVDADRSHATVALAVTAKVSDAAHKKTQSNLYRITVHLQHADSGAWEIDSLEFVQ